MTKPTGNPVGRPKTKEYSTLLARVPQDLVDRVKHYASIHRSTVAELIRDGLEWRITEGDPRNAFLYDTNHTKYSSNTETQATLEGMDLTPDMLDAEDVDERPLGESVDMTPQTDEQPESVPVPPYDPAKYRLGKLCPRGHAWGTTGQSLRTINKAGYCLACNAALARDKRQGGKVDAAPVASEPAPDPAPQPEAPAAVDTPAAKRGRARK